MRKTVLAAVAVLFMGCDTGTTTSPKAIQINGHDYYEIGMGDGYVVIDNHECKKCRAELLQHFEAMAEPVK